MPKPKKTDPATTPMHASPAKKPHAICGAKKRDGSPCASKQMPNGRCRMHGGKTPIQSGRYSVVKRPRLAELIAKFEADTDPTNILPEVAMLRALITDYVERYDEFTEALIAWHADWREGGGHGKPHQVLDILSAAKFIGQIGSLVERIEKQRAEGAVSLEAVNRYVEQLGMEVVGALREAIADEDSRSKALAAVDRRWESVAFDTGASKPRRGRSSEGAGES